jgi:hypothetical protein
VRDEERQEEARRALDRAARDAETVGTSALARAGRHVTDHFAGRDAANEPEGPDPIEIWGRRIGRALSLVGVVVLTVWLGFQLGWW